MDLNLSESLYAYDLLLKQGKLLISEMASKDVDEKDTSIMKAFGYQYYYYYLYYYFNNIRQNRLNGSSSFHTNTQTTKGFNSGTDEEIDTVQNDFHSNLMQSVYIGQFCNVIPRESTLAPVKLFLGNPANSTNILKKRSFAFTWNMFDSIKSIKIFTKVLCKDLNIPYDEKLSRNFEKQVLEASIVECDFALLVEMVALEQQDSDQIFKTKIKINITPEQNSRKICEYVEWNLLSSDSEISKLVKKSIKHLKTDEDQLGTIMYYFKRDVMVKKKDLVESNCEELLKYSQKHMLRTPFICRRKANTVVDQGPFLLSQKMDNFPEVDEKIRTSYKERFKILTKLSKSYRF